MGDKPTSRRRAHLAEPDAPAAVTLDPLPTAKWLVSRLATQASADGARDVWKRPEEEAQRSGSASAQARADRSDTGADASAAGESASRGRSAGADTATPAAALTWAFGRGRAYPSLSSRASASAAQTRPGAQGRKRSPLGVPSALVTLGPGSALRPDQARASLGRDDSIDRRTSPVIPEADALAEAIRDLGASIVERSRINAHAPRACPG